MIGAILALLGLAGMLFYLNQNFPQLGLLQDMLQLGLVFAGVFLAGVLISLASTYFATQRFLNLRTDDLYY
jgi:cell division transport system permease protein